LTTSNSGTEYDGTEYGREEGAEQERRRELEWARARTYKRNVCRLN
jgi:hypothetical protein